MCFEQIFFEQTLLRWCGCVPLQLFVLRPESLPLLNKKLLNFKEEFASKFSSFSFSWNILLTSFMFSRKSIFIYCDWASGIVISFSFFFFFAEMLLLTNINESLENEKLINKKLFSIFFNPSSFSYIRKHFFIDNLFSICFLVICYKT